jgi:hypothetical protein
LKIFLLQEEPQWFLKEDWGLKKWLTKFKTKKVVSITYLNSMFRFVAETEFRRDEKSYAFLTVSLDKHTLFLGLKEEQN